LKNKAVAAPDGHLNGVGILTEEGKRETATGREKSKQNLQEGGVEKKTGCAV